MDLSVQVVLTIAGPYTNGINERVESRFEGLP